MTEFLFPDNTVLCNFAAVDRLDLLESVLHGRGRWTAAVEYEASRSAEKAYPQLLRVSALGWLGEPIEVTSRHDVKEIQKIRRRVFGGDDSRPLQHLGEAETCFVISEWPELEGSSWISDDQESLRYARHQGITTCETKDLMRSVVADGGVTAPEGFALLQAMVGEGRHLRLPTSVAALQA